MSCSDDDPDGWVVYEGYSVPEQTSGIDEEEVMKYRR
jgi:hypothetical protein